VSRARVSVIVRARNEERHLDAVLGAVRAQRFPGEVELIVVENGSTDETAAIAARYADLVLPIDDYRPGAALNCALRRAGGATAAVLSAHTLPADEDWLRVLVEPLADPAVVAVYGGQVYPQDSRFLDKRDLDIFSTTRSRREWKDSDFWNANSAFRRSTWEALPFEEGVFELEDHYWTKCQLPSPGRYVRFEPRALVYHYGHAERNDRTFLPRDRPDDETLIASAIGQLESDRADWPQLMSAGLTLASLSHVPGVRSAVPALGRRLSSDPDFDVRWRSAHALGRIGGAEAVPYLVGALRDESFYPRDEAAWSLARLGGLGVDRTCAALSGLAPGELPFAALALGRCGVREAGSRAVEVLASCLRGGEPGPRRDAAYFAGEIVAAPGVAGLERDLVEAMAGEEDTARGAHWSWGMLASSIPGEPPWDCEASLVAARNHEFESVRAEAVVALGRVARRQRSSGMLQEVAAALDDEAGRVRWSAVQTLAIAAGEGWEEAAAALAAHPLDPDFGVRFEHGRALAGRGLDAAPR